LRLRQAAVSICSHACFAQKLTERLNQQVVVDNRPGAGGNLSAEITARAAPDGYTNLHLRAVAGGKCRAVPENCLRSDTRFRAGNLARFGAKCFGGVSRLWREVGERVDCARQIESRADQLSPPPAAAVPGTW
jgi:hypothetical protein